MCCKQEPINEYSHLKPQEQTENEEKKSLNTSDLLTFGYQIACGMVNIHTYTSIIICIIFAKL